jgi:regulator of replication initiation timing
MSGSSLKEFDQLEEKINRLIAGMRALRDENQKLKKELQESKHDSSQREGEKGEIRKKIASLIDLVDSLGE